MGNLATQFKIVKRNAININANTIQGCPYSRVDQDCQFVLCDCEKLLHLEYLKDQILDVSTKRLKDSGGFQSGDGGGAMSDLMLV